MLPRVVVRAQGGCGVCMGIDDLRERDNAPRNASPACARLPAFRVLAWSDDLRSLRHRIARDVCLFSAWYVTPTKGNVSNRPSHYSGLLFCARCFGCVTVTSSEVVRDRQSLLLAHGTVALGRRSIDARPCPLLFGYTSQPRVVALRLFPCPTKT